MNQVTNDDNYINNILNSLDSIIDVKMKNLVINFKNDIHTIFENAGEVTPALPPSLLPKMQTLDITDVAISAAAPAPEVVVRAPSPAPDISTAAPAPLTSVSEEDTDLLNQMLNLSIDEEKSVIEEPIFDKEIQENVDLLQQMQNLNIDEEKSVIEDNGDEYFVTENVRTDKMITTSAEEAKQIINKLTCASLDKFKEFNEEEKMIIKLFGLI